MNKKINNSNDNKNNKIASQDENITSDQNTGDNHSTKNTTEDITIKKEDLKKIMQVSKLLLETKKELTESKQGLQELRKEKTILENKLSMFGDKNVFLNNELNRIKQYFNEKSIKHLYELLNSIYIYLTSFKKFNKSEYNSCLDIISFLNKTMDLFLTQESFILIAPEVGSKVNIDNMNIIGIYDQNNKILHNIDYNKYHDKLIVYEVIKCGLMKDNKLIYKTSVSMKIQL